MLSRIPIEAYRLGTPIKEYRTAARLLWQSVLLIIPGILWIYFVYRSSVTWLNLLIGSLPVIFGVYQFTFWLISFDLQILVFEAGIALTRNGETELVRWREIVKVFEQDETQRLWIIPLRRLHRLTLEMENGTRHVLDRRIGKIDELADQIKKQHTRLLLPAAGQAILGERRLQFDTLSLSSAGVGHQADFFPWEEVLGIQVDQGLIVVHRKDEGAPFATVMYSKTANALLLLILADKFTEIRSG